MNTKNQLSREIVAYIQNNGGQTMRCVKFIEYEFDLRMIAKHELREYIDKLLSQCNDIEAKIYLKDIRANFCSEVEQ